MTDYTIDSDGTTVWVNGTDGLLGRFGLYGADVHRDGVCISCLAPTSTRGKVFPRTHAEAWGRFKALMLQEHEIDVPEKYRPARCAERKSA